MTYPWTLISTQNIDIQSDLQLNTNSGNTGEVIFKESGTQVWKKINGLLARYTDSTNSEQNVCGDPLAISFNTEVFNTLNIEYSKSAFRFALAGYYLISFQCLLSNSDSQCLITFFINNRPYYGNYSTYIPGSSNPVSFIMNTMVPINDGDVLTVVGEKINGGPSFLLYNTVSDITATQLLIKKL